MGALSAVNRGVRKGSWEGALEGGLRGEGSHRHLGRETGQKEQPGQSQAGA